jgi:hypothetical protein
MTPNAEVAATAREGATISRQPVATVSASENGAPPPAVGQLAGCPMCGDGPKGGAEPAKFVYALGRIEPRFPSVSLAKEFAQATGRVTTAGLTDRQTLHAVLAQRQNRYLVRSICWMLTVEGLDTYALVPRDPADFDLLVEALRPTPSPMDIDAVIGARGPLASPELCGGSMVAIVVFDQVYSFDRDALLKAIPRPKGTAAKEFNAAAEELLARVMQLADNAGATDEHRALNYLVLRYPAIHSVTTEYHARSFALSGVEVRPSRLSGTRTIVDVIFLYTSRETDVTDRVFVRVDVTEVFPFLVTKLSPYYER